MLIKKRVTVNVSSRMSIDIRMNECFIQGNVHVSLGAHIHLTNCEIDLRQFDKTL